MRREPTMENNLGANIRRRRQEIGLTIAELASQTGFSKGYISQVERSLVNPSLMALGKIAESLKAPVTFFLNNQAEREEEYCKVVLANERKTLKYPHSDVRYRLLTPDLRRKVEFVYVREPAGTISGREPFQHEGEEVIYVISGTLEYSVGDQKHILRKGDAIWHKSSVPHSWRAIGDEELEGVAAIVPPSF